jgi:hypothetical protein
MKKNTKKTINKNMYATGGPLDMLNSIAPLTSAIPGVGTALNAFTSGIGVVNSIADLITPQAKQPTSYKNTDAFGYAMGGLIDPPNKDKNKSLPFADELLKRSLTTTNLTRNVAAKVGGKLITPAVTVNEAIKGNYLKSMFSAVPFLTDGLDAAVPG